MIVDEQDCVDRINAYTRQDWQPLFALIPKIENTSIFGEWAGGDKDEEGAIQFPYCVPAPAVSQFLEIVYAIPIVIDFDWGAWDEGRKMASDKNFDFDSTDLIAKCKLITAIVRNDRFCEGALVAAFESGLILKILKSMEKIAPYQSYPARTNMDSINVCDFNLEKTLKCGQLFRYDDIDGAYFISHRDRLFKIRQERNQLMFSGVDREFIRDFFRLGDDYQAIIKSISKDDFMREVIGQNYGMRIMRQDPWECLISYMCSPKSKITMTKHNLSMISKTFGSPILHEDHESFSFPEPGKILNYDALRACKTGFRSKFIHEANKSIEEKKLIDLRSTSYEHAKEELIKIKGIGDKIADCISLFSLDKLEAFPVDTWIRKIMTKQYFGGKKASDTKIRAFARDYFGIFRGYANQYLFLYQRMLN